MPKTQPHDLELSDDNSELIDRQNVLDEAGDEEGAGSITYAITSYGSDPDVEGLVRRMRRQEIYVPPFQREYIWTMKEASRFVESLLLGLPVPGVFFAKDEGTNRFQVIDGQQRLKTLLFFFDGVFNPIPGEKRQRVFRLIDVQEPFLDKTWKDLPPEQRSQLESSVIHVTTVKQDSPADDDTSIYHIFERLNSGGRRLAPQEIRTAAYHGPFISLLEDLNGNASWRSIYGKPSPRLKDEELILRFFALYHNLDGYERPMNEFLNKFAKKHSSVSQRQAAKWKSEFTSAIDTLFTAFGGKVFRPERALNAAVFDAVMVGIATRLKEGPIKRMPALVKAYDGLLASEAFVATVSRATADEKSVKDRRTYAVEAFSSLA